MKLRLITIGILVFLLITSLTLTVMAETDPVDMDATQEVIATEEPYYTEAPTETYVYSEPTDYEGTDPTDDPYQSDSTDPSGTYPTDPSSVPETNVTGATEYTEATAPTEPAETSTYSDYESPDPVYTPGDQDFETNPFETIKLDLDAKPSNGKGSFEFIQNNNSKGNDSMSFILIIGIALLFVSLAGFTFAILYKRGEGKKAKAAANSSKGKRFSEPERSRKSTPQRKSPREPQRRNSDINRYFDPDDYNDGF